MIIGGHQITFFYLLPGHVVEHAIAFNFHISFYQSESMILVLMPDKDSLGHKRRILLPNTGTLMLLYRAVIWM